MARKNNKNVYYFTGLECIEEAPKKYNSGEVQKSKKYSYKDYDGGSSSRVTKTCKAGDFLDRRSGREGYREEANYKSTYKVNDKAHGVTTEYETSVKCKKTTTYDNPNKCNNYKRVNYY
ncbi:hypothetical protein RND71_042045 [Anisodus tanguticus]|uniref:Uncharacterized protein n=1 Tax=Anisodus tanguticus TaxID=243964 RepID=A0AAE1QQ76_9SOLA|nr:hypothetical protein RND71_042045 [Anisodus tanguticus]